MQNHGFIAINRMKPWFCIATIQVESFCQYRTCVLKGEKMEQFVSQLEQWHLTVYGLGALAIVLLFFVIGWKRGMVKEIISLVYIFLVIGLVWFLQPYVERFMEKRTPVYAAVEEKCQEAVENSSGYFSVVLNNAGAPVQETVIQSLKLPDVIRKELSKNNNAQVYKELGARNFTEYLSKFLSKKICRTICFIVTWLLACLIIAIIAAILNAVASLPVLREVNKLGGGVLGAAKSLVVIWFALIVVTLLTEASSGEKFLEILSKDAFISFLYDKNPLMYFIMAFS